MGLWPGVAFTFAMICLEFQFPVTNAIERGFVSAERDGYIDSGQRPSRSHSLAQSEAAGQVHERKEIATAQRANRSIVHVPSSTERPARWASTGMVWVLIPGPTLIAWPRLFERLGLWPGVAFTVAMICLEFQFPLANAIERGIVSAERDGYIVSGQWPIRSHSLAQSKGMRSRLIVNVGPFCRKGLSPQGEPVRRGFENVRLIQVDLMRSGRGEPRSPARQTGPTKTAAWQAETGILQRTEMGVRTQSETLGQVTDANVASSCIDLDRR